MGKTTIKSIYTVPQAADEYHIGRGRIYRAIQTGELKAYRPNSRSYLLLSSDIEDWIAGFPYFPIAQRKNSFRFK